MNNHQNSTAALIVFIRNPKPGEGKRRIAASVGDQRTYEIYLELLEHTRALTMQYHGPKYLFYSDFIDETDDWPSTEVKKYLQANGDLGEKMTAAFEIVMSTHDHAMIIGSDCPEIQVDDLQSTDQMLKDHDIVIGPATDGGYYLLGMSGFHPGVFKNVPWSVAETSQFTRLQCQKLGLNLSELTERNDIDTIDDYRQWKSKMNEGT